MIGLADLDTDMNARPEIYTVWFRKYMHEFRESVEALASRAPKI